MNLIKKYINKCIVEYANNMQARAAVTSFYSNGVIDSIKKQQEKEKQTYNKLEIDDLKLRICVLEDAMKEHRHWSPRDILGISDIKMGKIPSRKNETKTK